MEKTLSTCKRDTDGLYCFKTDILKYFQILPLGMLGIGTRK